jgi:aminopeptidase N
MKGAFFFRAVAEAVGVEAFDEVLAGFFAAHVGEAAGLQELLDFVQAQTGFDPEATAEGWLRSLGRPDV